MKHSKIISTLIYSVILMFFASIGGSVNMQFHLFTSGIIYFLIIYFLIRNEKTNNVKLLKTIILIGTFIIAFLILHLVDKNKGLFLHNLPFIIFPIIAAYLAYIATTFDRKKFYTISGLFITGIALFSYLILPNWVNWRLFPNAMEKGSFSEVVLETKSGDRISTASFSGKTTVIDFWGTRCGICYKKFPEFEKLHISYRNDTSIVFYSIHLPVKYDSLEKSKTLLDQYDYSFTQLFGLSMEDMETFGIPGVPMLVVVDEDMNIIYRGGLNTKWYEVVYNARRIINMETETY